jgi:hypothetical protein
LRIFCASSIGRSCVDKKVRRPLWATAEIAAASSPAAQSKELSHADTLRIVSFSSGYSIIRAARGETLGMPGRINQLKAAPAASQRLGTTVSKPAH